MLTRNAGSIAGAFFIGGNSGTVCGLESWRPYLINMRRIENNERRCDLNLK